VLQSAGTYGKHCRVGSRKGEPFARWSANRPTGRVWNADQDLQPLHAQGRCQIRTALRPESSTRCENVVIWPADVARLCSSKLFGGIRRTVNDSGEYRT